MKIVIDIPKEFENHYKDDKFLDSLCRVRSDLVWCHNVAGRYEYETVSMLIDVLLKSEVIENDKD